MSRTLLSILLIVSSVNASAQAETITQEFLQGHWSLEKASHVEQLIAEEYVPRLPDDNIWIFKGDTCTRYNYPFALIEQSNFAIDSGSVVYPGWKFGFAAVKSDSGKLVAYMNEAVLIFRRDTLTKSILNCLNILLRDTVNPGLMIERYYMVTHFVPDDEEAYDFTPPVKMPRCISFKDSAEVRSMLHSGVIYLRVNGKKRDVRYSYVEWDGCAYGNRNGFWVMDVPVITLVPGSWWTGDEFQVKYRANEKKMIKSGNGTVQKIQ